jgi:hypothetical protein
MISGNRHAKMTHTNIASTHAGLNLPNRAKNEAAVSGGMTVLENEAGLPYEGKFAGRNQEMPPVPVMPYRECHTAIYRVCDDLPHHFTKESCVGSHGPNRALSDRCRSFTGCYQTCIAAFPFRQSVVDGVRNRLLVVVKVVVRHSSSSNGWVSNGTRIK